MGSGAGIVAPSGAELAVTQAPRTMRSDAPPRAEDPALGVTAYVPAQSPVPAGISGSERPPAGDAASMFAGDTVLSNFAPPEPEVGLAATLAAAAGSDLEGSFQIGAVVGYRYELLAKLGAGGMGSVYKARDHMADEVVAIKFLAERLARHPEIIERFRRELKAARKIVHPGVVRLYDLGEVGGQMALTMEFIEGETLEDRIERDGPLTKERWVLLVRQLSEALAAAHAAGILHRDIKPANVLIRSEGDQPLIADFGVSRIGKGLDAPVPDPNAPSSTLDPSAGLTQVGQLLGTPLYMAPELLEAPGLAAPPSTDVYAMGLLLFEAATGKQPHPARTLEELRSLRKEPLPHLRSFRSDLPDSLASIVDRCVRIDPAQRFENGVALANAVEAAIRGRPRKIAFGLGALLVAGVLAGAGYHAYQGMLPARNRSVWIDVEGPPGQRRLGTAIRNMTRRGLALAEERVSVATAEADANVKVRVAYLRDGEHVRINPGLGPAHGRLKTLRPIDAGDVAAGVDNLVVALRESLGKDQPVRKPDPVEQAEMGRLETDSFEAYREYRFALRDLFATAVVDADAVAERLEKIRKLAPKWPHAYALAAVNTGLTSEPAQQAARDGLQATGGTAPGGRALLEAILDAGRSEPKRAIQTLQSLFDRNQQDIVVGWLLFNLLESEHRTDDAIGVLTRLHDSRPDLQFGADLAGALRAVGRDEEVEPLLESWLDRAPDAEQAYTLRIVRGLDGADLAQVERDARELIFLFGEAPHRTAMLCDVLIAAGQTKQAQPLADRLLGEKGVGRVRGLRRLGDISILQGRFSPAFQALSRAVVEGRPYGFNGELAQSLEAIRLLSKALGRVDDVRRYTDELRVYREEVGPEASAVVLDYDLALIERKSCLTPTQHLERLPEGPTREVATRDALRVAAARGCVPCRDVVAAGRSPTERNVASLYQFGECAEHEGELRLAKDAFETVRRIRTASDSTAISPSPYHTVLARYRLAVLAEKQNLGNEARAHFKDFLSFWGQADHPIPEVQQARARLAALE